MDRDLIPMLGLGEPVSSLSHLLMAVLVLIGGAIACRRARDKKPMVWGLLAYTICVGGMFVASGSYHSLPNGHPWRDFWWRLDHAAIWLALMGTFTGVMATYSRWDWGYLIPLWSLALVGVVLEMSVLDELPLWVSPLLYVAMGWANLPILFRVRRYNGLGKMLPMLFAGTLASIGGVLDSLQRPVLWPGVLEAHELLHGAISVASVIFFVMIFRGADGRYVPSQERVRELATARV